MKVRLLRQPLQVQVKFIKPYRNLYPDCTHQRYCPIKDDEFEATAHALWELGGRAFLAIVKEATRLVVPISFLSPYTVNDIYDKLESLYVSCLDDIKRYGIEAFIEDIFLIDGEFDITINSIKINTQHFITTNLNYKWDLHGHTKPVKNIERIVCFDEEDRTNIMIL